MERLFNAQKLFFSSSLIVPTRLSDTHRLDFWQKVKSTSEMWTHWLVFTPSPTSFIFIHLHSEWDIPVSSSSCLQPTVPVAIVPVNTSVTLQTHDSQETCLLSAALSRLTSFLPMASAFPYDDKTPYKHTHTPPPPSHSTSQNTEPFVFLFCFLFCCWCQIWYWLS